ncbi:MAG: hypothetical protein PS018_20335 [bacterium]|nr:hypothetical protein [bacterium]
MPVTEYSPLDAMERSDAARLAPLMAHREANNPDDDKRDGVVGEDDGRTYLSVRDLRNQYLDYINSKGDEIEEQKDSRRYYHGAQLTAEQLRVLKARHQPVQIWNRIGRKINGIVGVIERTRCDPKAEGRDPKSEEGAEIATQSIRYVCDRNQFKNTIEPIVLLQGGIEGITGTQVVLRAGDKGDPDIGVHDVVGDEYFYDPRSYRFDFKDVRYEGIAKWLDVDAAIEMFPDKADDLEGLFVGDSDLTTNSDREIKWIISTTRRLRLIEHWYKHRGRWCWAFYVANTLLDQGVSPFVDENGQSESSFDMFCSAIDQDGDRYSFVRTFKGPQDALNQGKSKTLALANARRVISEKGAVDDVEIARREVARHDGYVEINPGKNFKIDDSNPDIAIFTSFTDDAKNEMDGFANSNIAAMTGVGLGNLSGKAIELLRQPGMAELGPFVLAHRAWKLNVYRKIWNAVQRHWTAERWIRVNTNEKLAQFIQLNGVDLDEWGRPTLVNAVGALDVNIVLDEGPDIISMMQETYDTLKGYQPGTFPPQVLIEMNPNLPRSEKDRLLKMMQPPQQAPDPVADTLKRLQIEHIAGRNAKQASETEKNLAGADQAAAAAAEKRAKVGQMQGQAALSAAGFVRDTLFDAHKVMAPFLEQQNAGQAAMMSRPAVQGAPGAPIGAGMMEQMGA